MLKTSIADGCGTKNEVCVTPESSFLVADQGFPPIIPQKIKIFRQFLTTDGTASGSSDMGIDGSSTNVDFFIEANGDNDLYITTLSFVITSTAQLKMYQFADNSPLTNGCRLFYNIPTEDIDIHDAMKTNLDFIRL